MDPLYLQDPIKPAATPQAAKGLRDAINNDSPMMSGFVSGTYGYGGSSLLGLANLAEVAGADSVGQGLRKKATALFDTAQKFTPSAMSLDSVKDFGSGVDYVRANAGQGLGSMLPVIAGGAAGLAPGLAAATAPMYGENIGRLEQDQTLSGMSAGQKALHAAPTAAVQGALNYVVPGGFAAAAGRQIASRTGTGALGKAGATLGTVGLVEGATEGGEELARQGMHTLANPERDTSGDNKQLLESFVGGMVGGSPIGAVQAGAGYVQDRMAEREQDTRTLAQKAGDAIADAGGALGRRQGERDAAPANAALDAIEQEARARGVPPREVIAERIQRLNTPVDLSDAFTEAEATQRVMQDDEAKRATADELVRDILNDPDAPPEWRRIAEEHVAAVQAGATNKHEETGMKLGDSERKRAGFMGIVDTIAKLIEPVAGKPAPAKRGSAMTPKKFGDIEYEVPAARQFPGEGEFHYNEFSGVPANERAASGEGIGRVGWMGKEYGETLDENRQRFYGKLFEQIEQRAAQSRQPSPVTPEVRRAVAQAPAKTSAEAMRREQLIGKFAVDLRSWLPVGNQLDRLSESLRPRNAFERYARQMSLVRQDNALRSLSVFDWRQLDMALTNFAKGNGDAKVRKQLDDLFGGPDVTGRVLEMYTPGRSNVNTQQYDPDGGRTGADRTVMQEDESFVEYGEADQEVGTQEQWVGENTTGFVPAFEQRRLKDAEDRIKAHSGRIEELRVVQNPSAEQKKEIQELTYAIVRAKDTPKARKYYDKNDESQRQSLGRAKEALRRDGGEGATIDEVGMVDREIAARDLTDPEDIKRAQLEIVNEVFPERAIGYSPENDSVPSRRALFEKELAELVRAANTRFKALRGERTSFTADALEFTDRDISDIQFRLGKEKLNNQKYGVARGTIAFEAPGRVDPLVTSAPKLIAKMLSKRERESTEKHQGAVDENFQLLTQAITSVLSKLGKGARFGYVVTTATPQGVEGEVVVMDGQRDEFPADFKLRDLKQGDKKKTITYGDVVQSRSNKDRDYSADLARRANQAVGELLNSEAVSDVSAMAVIEFHAENPKDAVNNAHVIALHRKFVGGQFEDRSEQEGRVSRVEEHDMKRELNIVGKKVAKEIGRSNLPKERYAQLYATRDEIKAALAKDSPSLLSAYRKYVLAVKEGRSGAVFRHTGPWSNDPDTSRELLRDSDYRKFLTDLRDKTNRAKVAEINRRLEETENEALKKKLTLYRTKLISQNREITLALNGGRDLRDTYLALNPEKTVVPDSWGTVASENEDTSDDSGATLERGLLQYGHVGENAPIQRDADGFTSSNPAYNMTGRAQSGAPTPSSRGEDNMAPNTTALPENARALYKAESPAESIVGVLAPRNGVEAAAKAWRTVKNATTDKMKKSRDLMARALHSISSMKPEDFRLTLNKELTAQQAQTMINRAKSVIDQEKVPDDRPDVVGRSAAARSALGEARQDDDGGADQARGAQRSEQNAQTPGEATTDAKRTAELKAALAEVKRLLGKDFDAQVSNELFDPVSGAAWSGEFDPQQMRILIAAGATDTMGTGRHEALHALFKMLRDMGHPEAVKVIENLAKNAAVMSQLKKHLADHKNALEQLKDPEEAAAYAFQFWMADRLKLGPQAKTFFQKVMDFLNKAQLALRDKVFGSEAAKTERERRRQDELALELLGAFRDGAMASPEGRVSVQAVLEANKQALEARRLNTRAFGHKLHNFLKQGVYSAASVFEDSANPHVKALGKMFFRMEGDVRGEKQSFLEAAAQANDRYQVKVRNILVKLDKDTAELVSKYMNNRTELKDIHHPEAHEAVKDLRDLLDDLLLYQRNMNTARWDAEKMEWVPMGEVEKNYYPRVWSINVLTEKQGEFIEKMTEALEKYRRDFKGFPEIEEFHADTMAKAILNKLINGGGSNDIEKMTSDLGITPWQASVNKRDLNWLDDVAPGEFTEYFSNDVAEVMTSYISQATKRAEYNHAFGRGGEKIREGMYAAMVHEMGGVELAEKAAARLKVMRARIKAVSPDAIGAIISEEERKPNLVAAAREVLLEDRLEALNPDMEWTKEMIAQVRLGEYGFLKDSSIKVEDVAKVREGVDKIHADAVAKLEPVTKAIMAMEGTLGREIDPTLRHVMSGVTTFQNFRLLPLALFASINDVVGMVARGGTMKDSFQAFTRGIKEVGLMWKGEYSQDELAKLAERLGTVGGGNYLDAMGQTYSSQFMYGKLRRWNDALFKWNGLEAWNRAARIQATGVAIEFIKRHVEKPNEHSKRYLEELFGKDYDTNLIMKDGDLDYSNDRVREAVLTWVNGAVLRPNASHRPIYASDPHYMLFYHLKQFAYSFHKVILRRTWIEAKAGNYTPAAALFTGYVPVSIAADVVKETLIMGDDDPWWTKGGLTAYLEHGVARANLGGVPQMWLGDIADPVMAFKDPGRYVGSLSNVAGPAPDQLIDLISVPFLEDKTLVKEAAGGVPGGVLIRRYVD